MTHQAGAIERRRSRRGWIADRLMSRVLHLPPAVCGYSVEEGIKIPMRDGVNLAADRYTPPAEHILGTVLVQSPYGRRPPYSNVYARLFAERGYLVVILSSRGTFGSGGVFNPLRDEISDGEDTVAWLRDQPWFTGTFATLGMSYLGYTQMALLADPPPELVASVVVVGFHDATRTIRGTGAFSLETAYGWADSNATQEDHGWFASIVVGVLTTKRRTAPAVNRLPLRDAAAASLKGRAPFYNEWLEHEDLSDGYWQARRVPINAGDVPVLIIGGWSDLLLEQTIEQYEAMNARGANVALTVGPWTHVGTLAQGSGIATREALAWLGKYLALDRTSERPDTVRTMVTGLDTWRSAASWPPATTSQLWTLHPGGRLSQDAAVELDSSTTFVYDPAHPTPTIGGRTLNPKAGRQDNALRETRADVLTFTTNALATDLEVAGRPQVELHRSADNRFVDIMVRICDVDPKGTSINISDAYIRLREDQGVLDLSCDPIHHVWRAGHRLRLQIAGGSHPQYDRNLGTGEPSATGVAMQPATHRIHHDQHSPSRVTLPVVVSPS